MRIVIIGNGPAAIAAIETFREHDSRSAITVVSREREHFYSPCPLAEYVELSVARERLFLRDPQFYARHGVELLLGATARSLDAAAKQVVVEQDGACRRLDYDRLLIAAGATAFTPPVPGLRDTPGVFALKTLEDADAVMARLDGVQRAVVIGSGFIGLEAAQALVRRGKQTTVLEALDRVLPTMLDPELSALVEQRLHAHGVTVRLKAAAEAVLGGAGGVTAVCVAGEELPADMVICAAGVRPEIGWLHDSGMALGRGILVDGHMQTSLADVYAAGDIVETADWMGRQRVIANWPNAVNGGRVAGWNMAGQARRFRGLEGVNVVRIFDLPVSSFGDIAGEEMLVLDGPGYVRKLALRDRRVVGGQFYGDVNGTGIYHEMMKKGVDIGEATPAMLAPDFSLAGLMPAPPAPRRLVA